MTAPIRILLQTTIPPSADDWDIARFSLLRENLQALRSDAGEAIFEVDARNRVAPGQPDPVLSTLDTSRYDELWLFAVDTGDGLHDEDCAGISRFRQRGGGLLVTRDHMDLGSSVCTLGGVGRAHHFHSKNPESDPQRQCIDDVVTSAILWPNYHSGANGDYQAIHVEGPAHPLLSGPVRYFPSHPHEGAVDAPVDDPSARVIASGRSQVSGRPFNLAVVFEASSEGGPAVAQSTFHHFADYNWDPSRGAPSFVSEPPGSMLAQSADAQASVRRYVRNLALWLAGRDVDSPIH
ncbi:MAG TPA: hypothetical protein VGC55_15870 [Dokdonella sp.]